MDFMIFDSAGNAVEAFTDEQVAIKALRSLVLEDPEASRHLALLAFDEEGNAVGEAVVAADVAPESATRLSLANPAQWYQPNWASFVARAAQWRTDTAYSNRGAPVRSQRVATSG